MSNDSSDYQNRYNALQQIFRASLPARLRHILSTGRIWLAAETQSASGGDFLIAVHKMAGSAGSFGFSEITILCQQIETAIRENNPTSKKTIHSLLDQLQIFIK